MSLPIVKRGRRVERKHYDWGDMALAFAAGFLACMVLGIVVLSRS